MVWAFKWSLRQARFSPEMDFQLLFLICFLVANIVVDGRVDASSWKLDASSWKQVDESSLTDLANNDSNLTHTYWLCHAGKGQQALLIQYKFYLILQHLPAFDYSTPSGGRINKTVCGNACDTSGGKKQYLGYICALIAIVCFGSNFIPVKKYDTGDGEGCFMLLLTLCEKRDKVVVLKIVCPDKMKGEKFNFLPRVATKIDKNRQWLLNEQHLALPIRQGRSVKLG